MFVNWSHLLLLFVNDQGPVFAILDNTVPHRLTKFVRTIPIRTNLHVLLEIDLLSTKLKRRVRRY